MIRFTKTSLFYYISILYGSQHIFEIIVIDFQLKEIWLFPFNIIEHYNKQINFTYN